MIYGSISITPPLSDSLPLVRVFWGCPITPSNGSLSNTIRSSRGVDIQTPQTAALTKNLCLRCFFFSWGVTVKYVQVDMSPCLAWVTPLILNLASYWHLSATDVLAITQQKEFVILTNCLVTWSVSWQTNLFICDASSVDKLTIS